MTDSTEHEGTTPGTDPPATILLLIPNGVLTQAGPANLWRGVTPGPEHLRALRRDRARRMHPAGSAHRAPAPFEVYDTLTGAWAPAPGDADPAGAGDALCWVLPDGRFMVGGLSGGNWSSYDPGSGRWPTGIEVGSVPRHQGRSVAGGPRPSVIAIRMRG